jgi:hypothetical protein
MLLICFLSTSHKFWDIGNIVLNVHRINTNLVLTESLRMGKIPIPWDDKNVTQRIYGNSQSLFKECRKEILFLQSLVSTVLVNTMQIYSNIEMYNFFNI